MTVKPVRLFDIKAAPTLQPLVIHGGCLGGLARVAAFTRPGAGDVGPDRHVGDDVRRDVARLQRGDVDLVVAVGVEEDIVAPGGVVPGGVRFEGVDRRVGKEM